MTTKEKSKSRKIYYTKPSISELEVRYATDAAANGWGDHCYDYLLKFEEKFRSHLRVEHAIATSSCTGALHLGLSALGIGSGDEVIIADINWIASVAPVVHLGAKPVFVDILPDTWCIDPNKIVAAITTKTKAIIAVHLYGNLCEMQEIMDIGRRYGLFVIEDAAEAIGSLYKGHRAGSIGDFGIFSFHGTKTITTGEGGMFVTNNRTLFEKTKTLSNHGRSADNKKQFWPEVVGFKFKMSNLQAAIGCAQMERIDELVARKREIYDYYARHLRDLPVAMNPEHPGTSNGFWMPTIVVEQGVPFERDKLISAFAADNIDGRVFFWPLSMLPMFRSNLKNVVSYGIYQRALNLPAYHDITDKDMMRVISAVRKSLFPK